jgi:type VI secretion system secreted protein Hcp
MSSNRFFGIAGVTLLVALVGSMRAAETVHLYLAANGQPVIGESSQKSLGRENSIECVYYDQKSLASRRYEALVIRKRIDCASPLLIRAAAENQKVEATFKFFRPNPTGDGTTEQFYTVTLFKARIVSVRQYVPDTVLPETSSQPPLEEITFLYQGIACSYTKGPSFEDSWGGSPERK